MLKKEADIVQKKEVKAVLFDLDGTLVDSFKAWFYVINDSLKYFSLKVLTKKEFEKRFGAPIEQDVKTIFNGRTISEVEHAYNIHFKKRKKYVKLFSESIQTLKNLKNKKIKLGLITSSTRYITLMTLNNFKLKKYFNVIVTMDDVKRRKPAPDMVLKACKKLKVKPENALLIGDTNNDMIAGERAGCITGGYKIRGHFKVNSLKEILKIIK